MTNQTKQDAYTRVLQAKVGSLVDASDDYLLNLQHYIYVWLDEVKSELGYRIQAAAKADEQDND